LAGYLFYFFDDSQPSPVAYPYIMIFLSKAVLYGACYNNTGPVYIGWNWIGIGIGIEIRIGIGIGIGIGFGFFNCWSWSL